MLDVPLGRPLGQPLGPDPDHGPDHDPEHGVRPGSFWARLAPADRQALRAMGRTTAIPPRGTLCHQGVAAPAVYVLFKEVPRAAGNAVAKEFVDSSEGDQSIIELFGAGDLVGVLGPWGHPQRGTVAALDHVVALRVERRKFRSLLAANPRVAEAMMHTVSQIVTHGGRRHAVRAANHPQRLAYHLLELVHRFGERTSRGLEVPLRLSQAELANWAGISRETLVRWFRKWREKGILAWRDRLLTVLDPERLRRAAGPWGDEWPAVEHAPAQPDEPGGIAAREPVRLEPSGGAPAEPELPADNPFFTGRDVSLRKLDMLVAQAEWPRAVVVQGMAGVGKTALALHWAHRAAGRFPDGILFTDLRGTSRGPLTPGEAMGQVLRAAGIPGDQLPRTEAGLAARCRSLLADRRMLLILDNAAGPEQVGPLLAAAASGLVVVTSRRRLPPLLRGVDVRTLELRELAADEAEELIAGVLGPRDPRVAGERRPLARLAHECGRLPLALAVMAGRLAENPDESIADAVRELTAHDEETAPGVSGAGARGGARGTAARGGVLQGVLGPTFEVAYRGLGLDQREAFRRLGLVAGPDFTAAALAALQDRPEEDARDCLEGLRQAYLVEDAAPGRYRMHDLLREFARGRALVEDADSDLQAAQRRLLAGYLAGARAAGERLGAPARPTVAGGAAREGVPPGAGAGAASRPAGAPVPDASTEAPAAGLEWFEAERRNLVAAVHRAARLGLHRTCWELADALFDFQRLRRYGEDNVAVLQAGVRAARAEEDWAAAAVMLHDLAVAHVELDRAAQAVGYAEDARRGFRAADPPDRHGEAATLATLADVHDALGRYPTAIDHARRALAAHGELGNDGGVAQAHDTLARAHLGLSDHERALEHADRALAIRRRIGDMPGVAGTLFTLARVHRRWGNVRDAVLHALEALYIRQEHADQLGAAQALTLLARMHASLGQRDLAMQDAEQALRTYRALGARHGEARALTALGMLTCDAARFAEAFTYCGDALRLHRDVGDRHGEAETLAQIGVVHLRLGRHREAREHLLHALEVRREIGDRHGEASDLEYLSVVMRRLGRPQEAFVLGLEALDLWHRLGARGALAGTLGSLARTYLRLGLPEDAERAARQALGIRRAAGDRHGLGVGTDTLAMVLRRSGRPHDALRAGLEALRLIAEAGDRYAEGTALVHLAAVHLDLGRAGDALETGRRALDLATELGDAREQAYALHVMARACRLLGEHARAAAHFGAEIAIRRDMDDHPGRREALRLQGASYRALGDTDAAADCARRVRALDKWLESDRSLDM
ncbi:tetratricopeptide repeat protein [Actinomadura sp. WMMB 499]|uniref:tetratricopeptide repeat protein n=1 Tax=Actinomadura sp. WMMB 499 TaxID=1219491 RepID=UPI001245BCC3|nr:tetratricopeptide repeat protein [Actinomadura sp. WMMB 499]QFG20045.1 tetratricopeptide repeat protein [Actinomadura sp. WMMB 499]